MIRKENRCPNFNHQRSNAPVRFCPKCGEIVNHDIQITKCEKEIHIKRIKDANDYCIDCGESLRRNLSNM